MLNQHTPTPENQQEEWRPVVGYEGLYEASSLGRIRSLRMGRVMSPGRPNKGYPNFNLCKGGKRVTVMVHLVVARAFLGPTPEGMQVHHKDHHKGNPACDNLEFVTSSQNSYLAIAAGAMPSGERCSWSRLTADQVREIRSSTETHQALADRFGVCRRTIGFAKRGKTWRGVA